MVWTIYYSFGNVGLLMYSLAVMLIYAGILFKVGCFAHEIGHAVKIHKYDKLCNTIISLRCFIFGRNNARICRISSLILFELLRVRYVMKGVLKRGQQNGLILTCSGYTQFKPEEIKEIAKAGMQANMIFGVCLSLLFALVFGPMFIVSVFLPLALNILAYNSKKGNWTDANIIRNPRGFLDYCISGDVPENSTYKYHNEIAKGLERTK